MRKWRVRPITIVCVVLALWSIAMLWIDLRVAAIFGLLTTLIAVNNLLSINDPVDYERLIEERGSLIVACEAASNAIHAGDPDLASVYLNHALARIAKEEAAHD